MTKPNHELSPALIVLMSIATGLAVASNYYAQPLLDTIARAFSLSASSAGFIVTAAQLGYAAGLLFLVPLGDMFERRRLIVSMTLLAATGIALLVMKNFDVQPWFYAKIILFLALLSALSKAYRKEDSIALNQRRAGLFDRDLTQVGIVHPHLGAVADQQLVVGLVDLPAEFSGAGKNHHAGRLLRPPAIFGDDNLGEIGAQRFCCFEKLMQAFDGSSGGRQGGKQQKKQ